ncbi:MAG: hypothetical protein E6R03_16365, partial [Hyphomicrobiaceae bacterium]
MEVSGKSGDIVRVTAAQDKEPIFTLPPIRREIVPISLSQTVDWGLGLFGIPSLHRRSRGVGIKVAVCDTGIDLTHPDLAGAVADSKDFTASRGGVQDMQGHGTHVAGTIAARDNSLGVLGVAPDCQLLIGKVLGDDGSGTSTAIANG